MQKEKKNIFVSRLFITFILVQVAVILSARHIEEFVFDLYLEKAHTETSEIFKGSLSSLVTKLETLPEDEEEWFEYLESIEASFPFPVSIEPYKEFLAFDHEYETVLAGLPLILDMEELFLLQRIGQTDQAVIMGPLPEHEMGAMVDLITWGAMLFPIAVFGVIWSLTFWRQLRTISTAAHDFGHGKFDSRAEVPTNAYLGSMADSFNTMADRIQQLINSHKELTHAVSHELRTPISRLRFGMEMLAESESKEEREEQLEGIQGDIDELEGLVSELLTYARFNRESAQLKLDQHIAKPWLTELINKARREFPNHSFTMQCEDTFEDKTIYMDRHFMGRAVANLLQNGARYGDGHIDLHLKKEGKDCLLMVDDNGSGIPEPDRENIFRPFVRLERSRSRATGGYGLGLSIVKQVALWHSGNATITDSPQGGARFIIRWPCDKS